MSKNIKKFRALQVTALLSAVSGATLIMSANSPVQAAGNGGGKLDHGSGGIGPLRAA